MFESISATMAPGQLLTVKGPNGAGKSTFLLCLARLLRPLAGEISWDGDGPDRRPEDDLLFIGHLAPVKQHLTLLENLRFWSQMLHPSDPHDDRVGTALQSAGLGPIADFRAANLSAGQTRRLSLARLLLSERPLWLLDEPTSELDASGVKWIGGLMSRHLANDGVIVVATHLDIPGLETHNQQILDLGSVT